MRFNELKDSKYFTDMGLSYEGAGVVHYGLNYKNLDVINARLFFGDHKVHSISHNAGDKFIEIAFVDDDVISHRPIEDMFILELVQTVVLEEL